MKKRKQEILHSKEQFIEQSTEQSTEQSSVSTEQSKVQSNDTYVYGVGMLAVLAIGVCVFFAYNNFPKNKKQANDRPAAQHEQKKDQPPKRRHML